MDLSGRPIVITGASSGIGRATAIACARAGMPVCIGARRQDKLDAVVREIGDGGGKAAALACNVDRPEECRALVDLCAQRFGSVYAVFANAGYGEECGTLDMTDQQVRAMVETNVFGSLNIIRPAVEKMQLNPGPARGHVLWCSSCLAQASLPMYGVYCATKAAQHMMSRAMNFEMRDRGVVSSSVHPIGTKTEFFDQMRARKSDGTIADHTPEFFMQTPERVAACVVACLRRPKAEVWIGLRGRLVRTGMGLANLFPNQADPILRMATMNAARSRAQSPMSPSASQPARS